MSCTYLICIEKNTLCFYLRSTCVGSLWSFVLFSWTPQQPMSSNFKEFPTQILILSITIFCPVLILEKEPVFPFKCWVLNKGTTGIIFITSLVWRGPWLGIESGTFALEARTLPLGYLGGAECTYNLMYWKSEIKSKNSQSVQISRQW